MTKPTYSEQVLTKRHEFMQEFIKLSSESVDADAEAIAFQEQLVVRGETRGDGQDYPTWGRCAGHSRWAAHNVREAAHLDLCPEWRASTDEAPVKAARAEWRAALAQVVIQVASTRGCSNESLGGYYALNSAGTAVWRRGGPLPFETEEVQAAVQDAVPACRAYFRALACWYAVTRSGFPSLLTPPQVREEL